MHKNVEQLTNKRRQDAIYKHNKATNIVAPSFDVGDVVLVRRATDRSHKLRFNWFGPRRVTAVSSSLFYTILSLSDDKHDRIHCARLLKYDDSLQGKEIPQDMIDLADRTEARYQVVKKIINLGQAPDGLFFQVEWEGLHDKCDWT